MDKHLEEYLRLCHRIYERMEREGNWPWPDNPAVPEEPGDQPDPLPEDLIQ